MGSEAHPASYTMATGSYLGVKRPGHGVDHPSLSSAEVKERVELYLYFPSGPLWPVIGWTLPFTFTFIQKFTPQSIVLKNLIVADVVKKCPALWK
jgi:hypothetical protein